MPAIPFRASESNPPHTRLPSPEREKRPRKLEANTKDGTIANRERNFSGVAYLQQYAKQPFIRQKIKPCERTVFDANRAALTVFARNSFLANNARGL